MSKDKTEIRFQPSDEALKRMLKLLIKTSVPRILAERKEVEISKNQNES